MHYAHHVNTGGWQCDEMGLQIDIKQHVILPTQHCAGVGHRACVVGNISGATAPLSQVLFNKARLGTHQTYAL